MTNENNNDSGSNDANSNTGSGSDQPSTNNNSPSTENTVAGSSSDTPATTPVSEPTPNKEEPAKNTDDNKTEEKKNEEHPASTSSQAAPEPIANSSSDNLVTFRISGAVKGETKVSKGTTVRDAIAAIDKNASGLSLRAAGAVLYLTGIINDNIEVTATQKASAG